MAERVRRGRPPLSEPHRAAVRLAVAHRAVALFAERGVAATSGDDIARAAGVSPRTLWRYFATKESCVRPLLVSGAEAVAAALREQPAERPLAEALRAVGAEGVSLGDHAAVVAVVRLARTEPGIRAVWLQTHLDAEPALAEAVACRLGEDPDALRPRVLAAMVNAALRVAVESHADRAADGPEPGRGLEAALREALRIAAAGLPGALPDRVPGRRLSSWSARQVRLEASGLTVHQYSGG
ncbi:TetR family transcriptional regulator [Streptacidiphilus sp. PB12-B1b]|uniref:TetR/AcrR family transcriptional regulator n=1 Tax=Streptacidiphilus sp. PB12-B1b TaxID=2705012 RepID=UPI0015FE425D|nr:TetR/AcrR family transcriptional regulator [Streptacidiphilus sp. PB12-B1b]QMU77724.1 TetR family transcriptional regulator [Streptacidiphilus sp. PB12-B1b]